MPCYCEPTDEELDKYRSVIRFHAKQICGLIKDSSHPTDRHPQLLKDTLKLIEHLYTGKCDEKDSNGR